MKDLLKLHLVALLAMSLVFTACGDDDDDDNNVAPDSYAAFDDVSYTEASDRLSRVGELTTEMKKGNSGESVSEQTLLDIFNNSVASATAPDVVDDFRAYLSAHASISGTTDTASNGTAGILYKEDGSGQYLVNAQGKEYIQLVEKGLFGACFLYQIAQVLTIPSAVGEDVDEATRQANWDLAFGYLGVPQDFPTVTEPRYGIGNYSNGRDDLLGTNQDLVTPFINGRFNITEGAAVETEARAGAAAAELVLAATGIHYINSALNAGTDQAIVSHALSEAEAFIYGIQFNPNKTISDADWTKVLTLLGDNFFEVSSDNLTQARDILATAYGIESGIASQL
ncbi:MAG: DUF4856 domain-containing protein [Bacteroidota bacterium]